MEQLRASLRQSRFKSCANISFDITDFSGIGKTLENQDTGFRIPLQKLKRRYSKFLYSLLMVASSWVLLLFEEKLQCRVPLISGKAVGQLAVIQQMGNWAQTGEPSNPAVQTRSNRTNWTFLEHLPFRLGLWFKRDVPACLALLSASRSLAAQSWKWISPVSRFHSRY